MVVVGKSHLVLANFGTEGVVGENVFPSPTFPSDLKSAPIKILLSVCPTCLKKLPPLYRKNRFLCRRYRFYPDKMPAGIVHSEKGSTPERFVISVSFHIVEA